MDPAVNNWLQLVFRWIHVLAGVTWIGHLYFFNWVNAHFAKTLEAETKKKVVPELMPRALYWFRWGAAWTWITGVLLLGLIYYMSAGASESGERLYILFEDQVGSIGVGLAVLLIGIFAAFIYDVIMRSIANVLAANTVSLILFAGVYLLMAFWGNFSGRALFIHTGAFFGTAMALNVWMRIWPAQKRIITATREGTAPDAKDVALAGLRSRHNTFMSVPLLFFMVSNHYPTVYGSDLRHFYVAMFIAIGFLATRLIYNKSAKVAGF
ncbi:MAG TPA: urate hydroxylase PuuD [Thermoanaerobaculia bacterium]|nr:urate hydroxylase PuuD [Thermoanaerobaculia bacterium]